MAIVHEHWAPPSGSDSELTEAGVHWDAVLLPAYLGDRVLARVGRRCGAVIRDPYAHLLYWFIRPGAATSWHFLDIAHVRVLGAASWVTMPPADRMRSAGPHWVRPAAGGRLLTDPEALHTATAAVIAEALGPREERQEVVR